MSPTEIWITPQKYSALELDGKSIEMDVVERQTNKALYKTRGYGLIRIQYHPVTSGKVCVWVMLDMEPPHERAMHDIDEHSTVLHPDQSRARYLCKAYSSGD